MLDWSALPSMVSMVAAPAALDVPDDSGIETVDDVTITPRSDPDAIVAEYSSELLAWRLHKPNASYPTYADREQRGFIVLKHYNNDGHILALRASDAETGKRLLAKAKAHFTASNTERISMWILPRSPMFDVVATAGMQREAGKGKNFGFLALEEGLTETLADAAAWDVSMLDSDVY